MTRSPRFILAATLVITLPAVSPWSAARAAPARGSKGKPAEAASGSGAAASGKALKLGEFGEWVAYASPQPGPSRVCYALAQAKARAPSSVQDTPGYLFVSSRPAEKVWHEVSLVMGYPLKEEGDVKVAVGQANFAFAAKGGSAWVRNPAEEARVVDAMRRGASLDAKATSQRGNATSDRYRIDGLAQALERVDRECPRGRT